MTKAAIGRANNEITVEDDQSDEVDQIIQTIESEAANELEEVLQLVGVFGMKIKKTAKTEFFKDQQQNCKLFSKVSLYFITFQAMGTGEISGVPSQSG